MKKDFIRDEGKIRQCESNIAKMNIFEFIYCYVFNWGYFKDILSYTTECFTEFFKYGGALAYNLLFLIFTPITLVLCAIVRIKKAKERCNKNKKRTRN